VTSRTQLTVVNKWATVAAANNAAWCDLMCRLHGVDTQLDAAAWTSLTRSPDLYPDAVTLTPEIDAADLMSRIDNSPGCSIKDSYSSLEMASFGFRILFDAQWIVRPAGLPLDVQDDGLQWAPVEDEPELLAWEDAWSGGEHRRSLFRHAILDDHRVIILAARAGRHIQAGAILSNGAGVVGISNFFASTTEIRSSWHACVSNATRLAPDSSIVGYETGATLGSALDTGFAIAGPLRVWFRDR
jgi:hypothetical protein